MLTSVWVGDGCQARYELFKRHERDCRVRRFGTYEALMRRPGGFVPLIVVIVTLDPLFSSLAHCFHLSRSLHTFLHPPDPWPIPTGPNEGTPRTLLPRRHPSGSSSFFAASPHLSTLPAPTPALDPETIRWLSAYPADPELVPLIASLKSGVANSDFVLSDTGLLYVKPEGDEPALLVPPAGPIRGELLEDAHFEIAEHRDAGAMVEKVSETFWWPSVEDDAGRFVHRCGRCRERGDAEPLTGLTGWTRDDAGSEKEVERAVAERKAQEKAERDALG